MRSERQDILVTNVPRAELVPFDEVARSLDTTRSALIRRLIRSVAAASAPAIRGKEGRS